MIAMLKQAEEQATEILTEHRPRVEHLISALEAQETLEFDEIRACLDPDSKVTPLKRP